MTRWDDVRVFLTLAEARSLAAAGRELGVRHTTVARRIDQLEEDLGVTLITRTPEGVRLTPAGSRVIGSASSVREAMLELERLARLDEEVEGVVRISVSQAFSSFLVQHLGRLRIAHPKLSVHVLVDNRRTDLGRGDAEVAIRMSSTDDKQLTRLKIGDLPWGLYASPAYLEQRGVPQSIAELHTHRFVGYCGAMASTEGGRWLREAKLDGQAAFFVDCIPAALGAGSAGAGGVAIPCFLGLGNPQLVWLLNRLSIGNREAFIVFHPDVGRQRRVRVVIDYVAELMRDHSHQLRALCDS